MADQLGLGSRNIPLIMKTLQKSPIPDLYFGYIPGSNGGLVLGDKTNHQWTQF